MTASLKWNKASLFQKTKRLFAALGDISRDDFLKRDLAQLTKEIIYKRVKSGKGVSSDSSPFIVTRFQRLSPLSANYKAYRRAGRVQFTAMVKRRGGMKKVKVSFQTRNFPGLGEFASPTKSNLTFTGQMLNSMTFDIKRLGFTILIPETRRREGKATNAQVARWVSQAGRPFMNLTAGEHRIVKSRMKKILQRELKRLL